VAHQQIVLSPEEAYDPESTEHGRANRQFGGSDESKEDEGDSEATQDCCKERKSC
jgi:hypothetical protein